MRRSQRLRHRQDFAAVYRHGRPIRSSLLVLRTLRTERDDSRFGFTVGRAVGKAVARNRLKRRLREAARSLTVAPGWDIVVNARPAAQAAAYHRLKDTLADLLARAGALQQSEEAASP